MQIVAMLASAESFCSWGGGGCSRFMSRGPIQWAVRHKRTTAVILIVVAAFKLKNYLKKKQLKREWANVGEDIVVLHSFPPSPLCPDISPFTMKLMTYLRMADIPYQVDFQEPFGPKGKAPWITLNGVELGDSQLIIQHISAKYDKNFSSHLSNEQKAVARAFQIMADEHLLWGLALWRVVEDSTKHYLQYYKVPICCKFIFAAGIKRMIRERSCIQGIGRHSTTEVNQIMIKDIESISHQLGDKQFLMGDQPCEADCAIFGILAQFKWHSTGSPYLAVMDVDFQNLHRYCDRMKEKFWPDWNQCLYSSA